MARLDSILMGLDVKHVYCIYVTVVISKVSGEEQTADQ